MPKHPAHTLRGAGERAILFHSASTGGGELDPDQSVYSFVHLPLPDIGQVAVEGKN